MNLFCVLDINVCVLTSAVEQLHLFLKLITPTGLREQKVVEKMTELCWQLCHTTYGVCCLMLCILFGLDNNLLQTQTHFIKLITLKIAVFRDVVQRSLVETVRRFEGGDCLHHKGVHTFETSVNFYDNHCAAAKSDMSEDSLLTRCFGNRKSQLIAQPHDDTE